MRLLVRFSGYLFAAGTVMFLIGIAAAAGLIWHFSKDLPDYSQLQAYEPPVMTRIHAADGALLGEYAKERRLYLPIQAVPKLVTNAFMAAEDKNFYEHGGIDFTGMARAALLYAQNFGSNRRPQGASTITQQVAKNFFFSSEVSFVRKVKEALLAMRIERAYSKDKILELYLNHIYLGLGAYGIAAASLVYFDKPVNELTVAEAAYLAALPKAPTLLHPAKNHDRAIERRNYVIDRLLENGWIKQADADKARKEPLVVTNSTNVAHVFAGEYFAEEVRRDILERYGEKKLYEGGLAVQTGVDYHLQLAANRAIDHGLRQVDKSTRGWRRDKPNVIEQRQTVAGYRNERWKLPMAVDDIVPAVVVSIAPTSARLRIDQQMVDLRADGYAWTHRAPPALFKVGDLIDVRIVKADAAGKLESVALEQTPIVQGALLAIDNHTGQVRAMVGGFNFERSKFNRAVQAARQVGSAFKPFVYTTAIDRGYTPSSIIVDEPISYPAGPNQPPYSPHNYDNKFEGGVTLRHALEESRNVPAVKMMAVLTPQQVINYAHKFGIEAKLDPYLSLALGAADITLMEMTAAYSVFPNGGVRMTPIEFLKISDRDGNVLEETRPDPQDAIRADTAFVMTSLLRGVVQRGTGAAAAALAWPLAGKTGTTDDYGDAWFIGFDPDITLGVWVGYDERKTIGQNQTGAVAALPIWMEFMKAYIDTRDKEHPPEFTPPGNIVFMSVDKTNGAPDEAGGITEAFISGTQPGTNFAH